MVHLMQKTKYTPDRARAMGVGNHRPSKTYQKAVIIPTGETGREQGTPEEDLSAHCG